MSKTHLVWSCAHACPSADNERFEWLGKFIYDLKPDMCIDLGDGADMRSLNMYDKAKPGNVVLESYERDIDVYNDSQEKLRHQFRYHRRKKPTWIGFEGNHECFQGHTEIFVKDKGWVQTPNITEGDMVMSLSGSWEPVKATHKLWHEGPMYSYKNQVGSFTVTPNHRVYYYTCNGNLLVKPAKDTPRFLDLPVATQGVDEESSCLTDAQVKFNAIKQRFEKVLEDEVKDWVYCITVESGSFLARQGGLSLFTGNCRIKTALSVDPRLEGSRYGISFSHLQTKTHFDEYHEYENSAPAIANYGGVDYAHFFAPGNSSRAVSGIHHAYGLIQARAVSSTCGHSHLRSSYFKDGAGANGLVASVVGCYKGKAESWAGQANRSWWKGVLVKREVENGMYEPQWISMDTLKKEYS